MLAAVTTAIYLVVAVVFQMITDHLPEPAGTGSVIRVRYPEGRGILRRLIELATEQSFAIEEIASEGLGSADTDESRRENGSSRAIVEVAMKVHGKTSVNELVATFSAVDQVEVIAAKAATTLQG